MYKTWNDFFLAEKKEDYAIKLKAFLDEEYAKYIVFPPRELMFQAFHLTPLDTVKVVIIGQDPYHQPHQAMGLSFSVPSGVLMPPSLQNIYKEIENDLGCKMQKNGDLTHLAKQGVLLLNAILTVRQSEPLSHKIIEYEIFLMRVLRVLNSINRPVVYLLWGSFAKTLRKHITNPVHLVLESTHPSPLSANRGGFFNNNHFSKTNEYLTKHLLSPIRWEN